MNDQKHHFHVRGYMVSLLLILVSFNCSGLPDPTGQATIEQPLETSIQFQKASANIKCTWNGQSNDTANILLPRIYALDSNTAFIFFQVEGFHSGSRSLILRSEDGGEHWQEVMRPLLRAAIFQISFINANVGWALAISGTEGPEDFTLYKSRDGGKSWTKIGVIPNRDIQAAVEMSFKNEFEGMIVKPRPIEKPGYIVLRTSDGGENWSEAESIPFDKYAGPDDSQSKGFDGTEWRLDISDDSDQIVISRRLSTTVNWSSVSVIPENHKVIDGCISDQ